MTKKLFCSPVRLIFLILSLFSNSFLSAQSVLPANRKVSFALPPPCMELRGFSFNETTGRWTSGSRAAVTFILPADVLDKPASLEFEVEPFTVPGKLSMQRVTVLAGNKLAAFWRCSKPDVYSVPLRSEQIEHGRITLVFLMPDCYRPPDAEDDPYIRTFALFFRSVTLKKEEARKVAPPPIIIRGKHKKIRQDASVKIKQKPVTETSSPVLEIKKIQQEKEPAPVKYEIREGIASDKKTAPLTIQTIPETKPSPGSIKTTRDTEIPQEIPAEKKMKLQVLVPEKEILFSEESSLVFFRTSGFSDMENDGRRTSTHAAFLRFLLPNLKDMPLPALEFDVAPASEECMETVIRLNENAVGKWKCSHPGKYYVLLGGISRKGGNITVMFELPGAKVPESMKDLPGARDLGLLFRSVKLLPDFRKVQLTPKKTGFARTSSELLPFPVDHKITPSQCGKMLLLNGFLTEPDGEIVNQDKIASFSLRIPGELFGTTPVVSFEIEPMVTGDAPVRYLNILMDSIPVDSIVCTQKQRFFVRLKRADSLPVEIALECTGGNPENYRKSYRLKNVSLYRESFDAPRPLIEQENKQTTDELERKWKAGELD